jgi:NAD-dependent deacetylase
MDEIKELEKIIGGGRRIVFFGGAGVSTASGIPDFRSAKGIYSQKGAVPPEVILSGEFFKEHTEEFYKFYKSRMLYPSAKPNAVHYALAKLEAKGKLRAVITQNIDGLHQQAGSKNVIQLHGTVLKNHCINCGAEYGLDYITAAEGVPACKICGAVVKPDVVLYGEELPYNELVAAERAVDEADVLIVGGTSLTVYPAAAFAMNFTGERLVVVNGTPTPADERASLVIHGDIAQVFSRVTEGLAL